MREFDRWILLRHSIDLVEIWRKLIDSQYWSRLIRVINVWIVIDYSLSDVSGTISSHTFVIFRDGSWLPISFLHVSTRSIDWRNKNWDSTLSHFWCKGTIRGIWPKKWMELEGRIFWCHSLDLVELWKKLIDSQYGSRIFTELWRFLARYSVRQALRFRYFRYGFLSYLRCFSR